MYKVFNNANLKIEIDTFDTDNVSLKCFVPFL